MISLIGKRRWEAEALLRFFRLGNKIYLEHEVSRYGNGTEIAKTDTRVVQEQAVGFRFVISKNRKSCGYLQFFYSFTLKEFYIRLKKPEIDSIILTGVLAEDQGRMPTFILRRELPCR